MHSIEALDGILLPNQETENATVQTIPPKSRPLVLEMVAELAATSVNRVVRVATNTRYGLVKNCEIPTMACGIAFRFGLVPAGAQLTS